MKRRRRSPMWESTDQNTHIRAYIFIENVSYCRTKHRSVVTEDFIYSSHIYLLCIKYNCDRTENLCEGNTMSTNIYSHTKYLCLPFKKTFASLTSRHNA